MDLFGDSLADPEAESLHDEDEELSAPEVSAPSSGMRDSQLCVPQSMTFCFGHQEPERLLLEAFAAGRLPHALIFSGPQGIGKCTFAFRFARFLFKYGNIPEAGESLFGGSEVTLPETMDVGQGDPVFSRVASGGHGGLLYIERGMDAAKGKEKAVLNVETVRKIAPFLRKTSAEGGWRVVIVDDADLMNTAAQNALLKILEEPPKKVVIILITHRAGALIPTIHSRSRVLRFEPLEERILKDLLARQGFVYSPADGELICDFAGGSIGAALRFADEDGPEIFRSVWTLLGAAPDWNWPDVHKFSDSFGGVGVEKRYALTARLMVWIFRRLVSLKARESSSFPAYLAGTGKSAFLLGLPQARLLEIADGLEAHFARSDFSNLDKRETVRSAFLVINP
ncbi:MAG: DNA polymerase III subunit delta' [Alphaproteobacteria bacterium]|nr:DNA polymerase III subunit delta' [Alphaproteobacteria bacterium]